MIVVQRAYLVENDSNHHDLNSLAFHDLIQRAKEHKVSAKGSRKDIISRIIKSESTSNACIPSAYPDQPEHQQG